MPGRNYSSDSYRFGFNGKENDNEVHNAPGTFQDYGMRGYDPRIGRFPSVDPIAAQFPMLTPYQFASNSPIANIDLDGREAFWFQIDHDEKTGATSIKLTDVKSSWLDPIMPYHMVVSIDGGEARYSGSYWKMEDLQKGLTQVAMDPESFYSEIERIQAENAQIKAEDDAEWQALFETAGLAGVAGGRQARNAPARRQSSANPTFGADFVASANAPSGKQGLTEVGRALQKHSGRAGSSFESIEFSHKTANATGLDVLKGIMNSDNKVTRQHANGGTMIFDKNTGRGFGISREGKFNGFRDMKDETEE